MTEPLATIVLALALLLMLVGLLGTFLPVVPGSILIFAAALIYGLVDKFQTVGWPTLVVLGLLTIVGTTADIWASGMGAKAGGASAWSVVAGLVGGTVGLLLFSLPGAVLGAILPVLVLETYRAGDWRKALKAGGGWAVGWILSAGISLAIGLLMVALFVWQVVQG